MISDVGAEQVHPHIATSRRSLRHPAQLPPRRGPSRWGSLKGLFEGCHESY